MINHGKSFIDNNFRKSAAALKEGIDKFPEGLLRTTEKPKRTRLPKAGTDRLIEAAPDPTRPQFWPAFWRDWGALVLPPGDPPRGFTQGIPWVAPQGTLPGDTQRTPQATPQAPA